MLMNLMDNTDFGMNGNPIMIDVFCLRLNLFLCAERAVDENTVFPTTFFYDHRNQPNGSLIWSTSTYSTAHCYCHTLIFVNWLYFHRLYHLQDMLVSWRFSTALIGFLFVCLSVCHVALTSPLREGYEDLIFFSRRMGLIAWLHYWYRTVLGAWHHVQECNVLGAGVLCGDIMNYVSLKLQAQQPCPGKYRTRVWMIQYLCP